MTARAAQPILASPAANIGLPQSAPPDGLTSVVAVQAERPAQQDLLVGERRVQLGDLNRPPGDRAEAAEAGAQQVPAPSDPDSIRWLNDVIQAGRSHSSRARAPDARTTTAAPSPTGAQSCARSGSATYGRTEQVLDRDLTGHLRGRVGNRGGPAARRDLRHVLLGPQPGLDAEPRLQRRDRHRVRPQRGHQVGVELQREHPPQLGARGLAEAVGQRDVRLAGHDLHPRLVQRPGAVHLHVRFHDRRDGADRVHRLHEGERPPGQVVRRPRAPEPDVALGQPGSGVHLREDRHQHLHPAGGRVLANPAGRLGEADDGDLGQMCLA